MIGCAVRFLREQRGEGTTSSALRIAVWVVVALGIVGIVGPKIYSAATQSSTCLNAASGASTSTFQASGGTPGC
ncbi:MAG TPA: hypothetical protein VNM16_03505 [Bacillota bacterium]|nr:hypothetical protein [Bacillota bacterium]